LCISLGLIGGVLATLAVVKENDIKYDDVEKVQIKLGLHNVYHHTTAAKKYPRNAESADHSAYYANAIAIKERRFGPDLFEAKHFTDPVVLDLIDRMTVEVDPDIPSWGIAGKSIITTRDGRRFEKSVDNPHGASGDPLTDVELEDKFRDMAVKYMDIQQIQEIFDTIWNLEKLDDMNRLTRLLVFPKTGE
jgi:2-methylcitrate dehydratase PrpD